MRCTTPTVRGDGWCGECAGYTTPAPPQTEHNPVMHWYWGEVEWRPATLDMDPDEAYEVDIAPGTVDHYARLHNVSRKAAILEIRGLLEDMITADARTETDEQGRYRVQFKQKGYGLMLTADRGMVVRYCTKHRERTWAQLRSGVASRSAGSGTIFSPAGGSGIPAWQRQAMSTLPIRVSKSAFASFARHSLGTKVTRDNVADITEQLTAHLTAHVLPKWQRTENETVDDGHGRAWLLVVNSKAPDGAVLATFVVDSDTTSPADA
jgi:hypothetical protein